MSKNTFIAIVILILAFAGLTTWSIIQAQEKAIDYDKYNADSIIEANPDNGNIGDHVRGKADSKIRIIEYADYQCPGCASVQTQLNILVKEYGDRIAFVFRNFPIHLHQNAKAAASAAESAKKQGHYAEMADILFANQATWSYSSGTERTNIFADLFAKVAPNGDIEKFKVDMGDPDIIKKIEFDYQIGNRLSKVSGTPSFYLNGEFIKSSIDGTPASFLDAARKAINTKLKEYNLPTGAAETSDSQSDNFEE